MGLGPRLEGIVAKRLNWLIPSPLIVVLNDALGACPFTLGTLGLAVRDHASYPPFPARGACDRSAVSNLLLGGVALRVGSRRVIILRAVFFGGRAALSSRGVCGRHRWSRAELCGMGCCSEAPVLVVPMPPRLQHYYQTATRTAGWEGDQQVEQTFGRTMPTGIRTTMDIKCGCPCHAHTSVENSRGPGSRILRIDNRGTAPLPRRRDGCCGPPGWEQRLTVSGLPPPEDARTPSQVSGQALDAAFSNKGPRGHPLRLHDRVGRAVDHVVL